MTCKPIAIVLGGTAPHVHLINRLKSRGYYTLLVDYYDNPPAKAHADMHVRESTLDQDKVLKIAEAFGAELVMSACVDQANVTACYVAEKMGLPAPYSYKTATRVGNKGLMKERIRHGQIPTPAYCCSDASDPATETSLRYPVMVKPADSCGSAGVKRADDFEDLSKYYAEAMEISRAKQVIVEELVTGIEVSVYGFITDHQIHVLMMSQRLGVIEGRDRIVKCVATVTPPRISAQARNKISTIGNKLASEFSLTNTAIHVQVIVDGDDVWLIEFAPRVGGGVSFKTIMDSTGFDMIDATIDSYLGVPVAVAQNASATTYAVVLIYARTGVFDRLSGADALIRNNTITALYEYRTKGMWIGDDRASASRVGSFVVQASSENELFSKIDSAIAAIEVYDSKDNAIMSKHYDYRALYRGDVS